jgi:hypothetical protein
MGNGGLLDGALNSIFRRKLDVVAMLKFAASAAKFKNSSFVQCGRPFSPIVACANEAAVVT